jgi:FkbM family methyltransferase
MRRRIVERLAREDAGYRLFRSLGRHYGVHDISVMGDYGLVEGSLQDTAILMSYARTKTWAPETNRFFVDILSGFRQATYIDIGANIGLTTLPIARNPRVACRAFEPEPDNYRYLVGNVARNCAYGNVEAYNMALFDREGVLDLELSDTNLGDHRIRAGDVEALDSERRVTKVAADRLDNVLKGGDLVGPVAVKIDTQGAEGQVFAGGGDVLAGAVAIVFEFSPGPMSRMGGNLESILAVLEQHFDDGAILAGDSGRGLRWRPIGEVAARMRGLMDSSETRPADYYDVFARKVR